MVLRIERKREEGDEVAIVERNGEFRSSLISWR